MQAILVSLLLSFASQAAIPSCWTTDGKSVGYNSANEEIADGQWLITADLQKTSKDDLVWLLRAVVQGNLRTEHFPMMLGSRNMILVVEAMDDGSEYPALLPREKLIERANQQLNGISLRRGVLNISCNGIAHPAF